MRLYCVYFARTSLVHTGQWYRFLPVVVRDSLLLMEIYLLIRN